jgi:hypothetical protein
MSASLGGGKSSGQQSSQVQMTPEQQQILAAQAKFLTDTAMPAYQKTIGGAGDVYSGTSAATKAASENAIKVAQQTGAVQQATGTENLQAGSAGLQALFDPNYEQNQINAALQKGVESARESQAGQNAMYGSAGGLGSSRMALADKNMASLNAQRQATAAADAQARVQANKAAAAAQLMGGGQTALTGAQASAANQLTAAASPQDLYSKYASVVFGTPQASTTANFAGTMGGTTQGSSKSSGGSLGINK